MIRLHPLEEQKILCLHLSQSYLSQLLSLLLEYSAVLTAGNERVSLNLAGNDTVFNVRFEAFGAVERNV